MSTVDATIEDYQRARQSLAMRLDHAREIAALGVVPAEVDAAEEHHARLLRAEAHGFPDDAWHSLVAARRYLATLPRPLVPGEGPPRRREMTLHSPCDAWTSRNRWNGTDGLPLALAAICGVEVNDVAPLFPPHGWVKRTLPAALPILEAAGLRVSFLRADEGAPRFGLATVQIDGPWRLERPDHDPRRKSNGYSHWVGVHQASTDLWVYDPFDLAWIHASVWEKHTLPFVKQKRGVDKGEAWHFRGFYEVETKAGRAFHTVTRAMPTGRVAR